MIIGITGSIGSGKSTVAKIFREYGFKVIDADKVAHKIMKQNTEIYRRLVKNFGNGILNENKEIDRRKLGNMVFKDTKKVKNLNLILHPLIIKTIEESIKKINDKYNDNAKAVIDAPLLLETRTKELVDKIIVVKTDFENVVKRMNEKFSKKEIEKILKFQMPLKQKLKYADFVIDNNKDLKHLENSVREVIEKL